MSVVRDPSIKLTVLCDLSYQFGVEWKEFDVDVRTARLAPNLVLTVVRLAATTC